MEEIHALTHSYISRGFAPVPVEFKSKACKIKNWQTLKISPEDVAGVFNETPSNIGIVLGEASGGLVDIDLDCREAIDLAPYTLPETGMIFGRESRPRSHWLYKAPTAGKHQSFSDPDGNGMLVEVRANGCMTVFPGSVHPEGEEIRFDKDGKPAEIAFDQLTASAGRLAAASLLLRHWQKGYRHNLALAVAGVTLRGGVNHGAVRKLISAVVNAARDNEAEDRLGCVDDTAAMMAEGKPVTGRRDLADIIGEKAADRFCEWLGLGASGKMLVGHPGGRVTRAFGGAVPQSRTWRMPNALQLVIGTKPYIATPSKNGLLGMAAGGPPP